MGAPDGSTVRLHRYAPAMLSELLRLRRKYAADPSPARRSHRFPDDSGMVPEPAEFIDLTVLADGSRRGHLTAASHRGDLVEVTNLVDRDGGDGSDEKGLTEKDAGRAAIYGDLTLAQGTSPGGRLAKIIPLGPSAPPADPPTVLSAARRSPPWCSWYC